MDEPTSLYLNTLQWILNHGETLQVYLFFGGFAALLVAERLFPKRAWQASPYRRWGTNLALTALVVMTLPLVPLSFITAAFWAEREGFGLLNSAGQWLPEAAIVVITLLIRAFMSFGTHLLNHKVPLLWRFHRVHHLDTELDVTSTVRFHPLEMPLSLLIGLPVVVGMGLSPWVLIFYELLDVTVTLFSHSNLRLPARLERWLHYLVVTPDLHKVHHSSYQPETDSNFSAVFPVWDIVFGTFRVATRQSLETMPLGLAEHRGSEVDRFWWLLASPFHRRQERSSIVEATS